MSVAHQPSVVQGGSSHVQAAEEEDHWKKAILSLSTDDRQVLDASNPNKLAVLAQVVEAVNMKKKICLEKRWKYKRHGKDVVIRDQLEKVLAWVEKFKAIGNTAVQYNAGHAALPWAGVLLVLQIAVNDSETLGAMVESIEQISHLITRCTVLESLYLRPTGQSLATEQLREAITKLYISTLRYLCKAKQYFERSTAKRLMVATVKSVQMSVDTYLSIIHREQARVDSCIQVIVAEQRQESNVRTQRLELLLRQLEQPIERSAVQLAELHDHLQQSERIALLNWLSKIPYRTIHRAIGKDVLPGTGSWILRDADFLEWAKSSVSSILFLHGIPGSGKTKLMYNVVDCHLRSANIAPAMTAYFYCARNPAEPVNSNPDEIMRSILKQLSSSRPELPIRAPVVDAFQKRLRDVTTDGGEITPLDLEECLELILVILDKDPAYLFLDALDECDIFRRDELFKAINTITERSASLLKVMVSSRDDYDISCHFANSPHIQIRPRDNGSDVERFVHVSLAKAVSEKRLLNGHVSSSLLDKIATTLIERADGMFRWTSLQIQLLCNRERIRIEEDILEELGSLPRGLKESYEVIYGRIMGLAVPSRILAIRVFQWLMCAQTLLTANELLAAVSSGTTLGSYTTTNILDVCCNLVVIDDFGVLRFAHLSVREYLESLETLSPGHNHGTVLQRCLDCYLRLNDLSVSSTDLKDDFTIKSYAALYWPIHYEHLAQDDISDEIRSKVQRFIFGTNGGSASYQDWINDAWNLSLYSETLESTNTQHECTISHRLKLGSVANALGSPIFLSCCFGWQWIIDKLIALNDSNLICRNDKNESGLYLASWWGHEEILKMLITQYDSTVSKVIDLEEALWAGVENRRTDIVGLLVKEQASGQNPTRFGESALQAAIRQDETTILCLLLGQGAPITVESFAKVCCTAYDEGRAEALDILLEKAASLERDQHYRLLMWFVNTEYDAVTRSLVLQTLSSGLSNAPSSMTPLLKIEGPSRSAESNTGTLQIHNKRAATLTLALRDAASNGETQPIDGLLDLVTEVSSRWGEYFGLHGAVRSNTKDVASLLLVLGADIDAVDHKGRTALWLSVKKGNYDMALFLIDCGANVNTADCNGVNLVHVCAELPYNQHHGGKVLQALLSRGASPNTQSRLRYSESVVTPLIAAVESKNYVSALILLDYGADIHGVTDTQGPALHIAASLEFTAMVRFLLKRGADPNARGYSNQFRIDDGKCTALHIAVLQGNYGIAKQLLQALADVAALCSNSWTSLHIAVAATQEHIIPLLVEHGADLEARSAVDVTSESVGGMTPLHLAVSALFGGDQGVVRRLIEMGADVNAKDDEGRTPLHYAVEGKLDIIRLLLRAGAHYHSPDKSGTTPAQTVLEQGCDHVKRFIDAYTCQVEGRFEKDDQLPTMSSDSLVGILDDVDVDAENILSLLDSEMHIPVLNDHEDDNAPDRANRFEEVTETDDPEIESYKYMRGNHYGTLTPYEEDTFPFLGRNRFHPNQQHMVVSTNLWSWRAA